MDVDVPAEHATPWPGGSKPHAGDDEASVVITGDQSLIDCAMAVDLRRNLTGIGLLYSTCRIRWQAVGHRTLRQCRLGKDSTVSGQRNTAVHQRGVRDVDLTFETH